MDGIYGGGTGPVANRPWFQIVERAYQRWSDLSGSIWFMSRTMMGLPVLQPTVVCWACVVTFALPVVRLTGTRESSLITTSRTVAENDGLDGDMVIDTTDSFYRINAEDPAAENRALFNVLMHEAGHGIGLGHVIPTNETKLMEPFISTAYLGAQHDDILGVQSLYGDDAERDDTLGSARDLGNLQMDCSLLVKLDRLQQTTPIF